MAEMKRGKLRSVSVRPMYDGKGKVSGHTVSADHEAAGNSDGGSGMPNFLSPIESAHETHGSATDKVKEHLEANNAKFGKGGRAMKDAIGSA